MKKVWFYHHACICAGEDLGTVHKGSKTHKIQVMYVNGELSRYITECPENELYESEKACRQATQEQFNACKKKYYDSIHNTADLIDFLLTYNVCGENNPARRATIDAARDLGIYIKTKD